MNKVDILTIRLNAEDNVIVAMRELDSGHRIDNEKLVTRIIDLSLLQASNY